MLATQMPGRLGKAALFLLLAIPWVSFADPPSSYDLRDVGGQSYVTGIKNQSGGTCWTHGAMAAIEGNLMITGAWLGSDEFGAPNLAEYHLDWWNGFNQFNNDDIDPPDGTGLVVHNGGDYRVTSAYLARGEGAVRDEDGQSYSPAPERYLPGYHIYYPRDIEFYVAESDLSNIDTIKNRIMTDGVIGTALCYNERFMSGTTHYQPSTSSLDPNHAVAIVGWNDYKYTSAPSPGAWLVKNSWGRDWGEDGYFWISYYDKHCGQHPEMGAVSMRNVNRFLYQNVYYHDYHGWRDTKTDCSEAFNAFVAEADEVLAAVSFFTAEDNVTYTVKVYDQFAGGRLIGEIASETGTIDHTGLHTIDLNPEVALSSSDDFYIYLQLSGGGHPYDRTSDVPVLLGADYRAIVPSTASPGESYYKSGGTWHDFYDLDSTANFCVKGLTLAQGLTITPELGGRFDGPPGGPFAPLSHTFEFEYLGGTAIDYEVTVDNCTDWITLSGDVSGTISPFTTASVTVELNANVYSLGDGAYPATISFTNLANHMGDSEREILLTIGSPVVAYEWTLDSDPGWFADGIWGFGEPEGGGGSAGCSDPTSGYTGDNVYGANLSGDYHHWMPERYLVSNKLDCTDLYNVHLQFWRWLGVDDPAYDNASIEVSADSVTFTKIWANGSVINDCGWVDQDFDISAVAANQPEVWLRWTMGPADAYVKYCGWNIDDIRVTAFVGDNTATAVDGSAAGIPAVFHLAPVRPNPFNPSTEIRFDLPEPGIVRLAIYDISGRLVRVLHDGRESAGSHSSVWNGTDHAGRPVAPGVYLLRLEGDHRTATRKMVLVK